jgi:hypothetical protein
MGPPEDIDVRRPLALVQATKGKDRVQAERAREQGNADKADQQFGAYPQPEPFHCF